jgi:hypothetical protein
MLHRSRNLVGPFAVVIGLGLTACAPDGNPIATPSVQRADSSPDSDATSSGDDTPNDSTTVAATGGGGRFPAVGLRLVPFDDCAAFLDQVKAEAAVRVGPYGLDGTGSPWWGVVPTVEPAAVDFASESAEAAPATAAIEEKAAAEDDGNVARDVVGTNTQETGIDEADVVKTDGRRIVTISDNVLTVIDITGPQPVVTGSLPLAAGWNHQMFLHDDRAAVVVTGDPWIPTPAAGTDPAETAPAETLVPDAEAGFAAPATTMPMMVDETAISMPTQLATSTSILDIDLSSAGGPSIVASLRVEGQSLSARLIDGRMLLALNTAPHWMGWLYPQSPAGEERALDANRGLVAESSLSDWTPQYELTAGDSTTQGDLLACDRISRPADFSGFDLVSVLDIDLATGLGGGFDPAATSGVLASGQTVYASLDRMYVATTRWLGADEVTDGDDLATWSEDYTTDLHAFAITAGEPVRYVASGSIEGTLLNQFSMDEHEGYLRVFATDGSPWNPSDLSETRLVVLAERDGALDSVGEVGGLGRGEALYSARMIGDRGFAVTFRQVDPFYVLDLSDPAAPQVTGELKIPGFSTYLHPVGEHRVLGVGRAATDDGVVTGLKLSLFDVADPAAPQEIAVWTLDNAGSQAEYDHRAFQMIGSTAIVPVQDWTDGFSGAVVLDIGDTITEIGRITHAPASAEPTTECLVPTVDDVSPDGELRWLIEDQYTHLQLCAAEQASGYGDWYCEVIPVDQVVGWWGSEAMVAELTALGVEPTGRLEYCFPDDTRWTSAITRSMIVDDTVWTMSTNRLEAHDLATLAPIGGVDLG